MGFFSKLRTPDYTPGENREFKHVIQETYNVYIGASMTYNEMIDNDDVPFKFKSAVHSFVFGEADRDMAIRDHIKQMKKSDSSTILYKQLKLRLTLNSVEPGADGKYEHRSVGIMDYLTDPTYSEHRDDWFIEEIIINKLSLMTVG